MVSYLDTNRELFPIKLALRRLCESQFDDQMLFCNESSAKFKRNISRAKTFYFTLKIIRISRLYKKLQDESLKYDQINLLCNKLRKRLEYILLACESRPLTKILMDRDLDDYTKVWSIITKLNHNELRKFNNFNTIWIRIITEKELVSIKTSAILKFIAYLARAKQFHLVMCIFSQINHGKPVINPCKKTDGRNELYQISTAALKFIKQSSLDRTLFPKKCLNHVNQAAKENHLFETIITMIKFQECLNKFQNFHIISINNMILMKFLNLMSKNKYYAALASISSITILSRDVFRAFLLEKYLRQGKSAYKEYKKLLIMKKYGQNYIECHARMTRLNFQYKIDICALMTQSQKLIILHPNSQIAYLQIICVFINLILNSMDEEAKVENVEIQTLEKILIIFSRMRYMSPRLKKQMMVANSILSRKKCLSEFDGRKFLIGLCKSLKSLLIRSNVKKRSSQIIENETIKDVEKNSIMILRQHFKGIDDAKVVKLLTITAIICKINGQRDLEFDCLHQIIKYQSNSPLIIDKIFRHAKYCDNISDRRLNILQKIIFIDPSLIRKRKEISRFEYCDVIERNHKFFNGIAFRKKFNLAEVTDIYYNMNNSAISQTEKGNINSALSIFNKLRTDNINRSHSDAIISWEKKKKRLRKEICYEANLNILYSILGNQVSWDQ